MKLQLAKSNWGEVSGWYQQELRIASSCFLLGKALCRPEMGAKTGGMRLLTSSLVFLRCGWQVSSRQWALGLLCLLLLAS